MYKVIFYVNLTKESFYCLLIQFCPIKSLIMKDYFIVEYFNKKDMKYSLEMIDEIKINNKYIKYKILDKSYIYIVPDTENLEIFEKFKCKRIGNKIRFENEDKMNEVIKVLKRKYVNYKKISFTIINEFELTKDFYIKS